jgi:hypothetical protein
MLASPAQPALQCTDNEQVEYWISPSMRLRHSILATHQPPITNTTFFSSRLDKRRMEYCFTFATASNEFVDRTNIHVSVSMYASDNVSLSLLFEQVVEMVGKSGL